MKKRMMLEVEHDVAETMKMLVESEGYSVTVFMDPRKGLAAMKDYDLLLLDIMMPKMSGRAVLAEMDQKKIRIPVIVVSAVGMPMEIGAQLSKEHPGLEFVSKTEMHGELLNVIKQKLRK